MANWTPVADAAASWLAPHPQNSLDRIEMAQRLAEAIGAAHPDDACQILTAALIDLSAGQPPNLHFLNAKDDATWWASIAAPAELCSILSAVLPRLKNRALHLRMRKELFMALWRSFSHEEQRRFAAYSSTEVSA